MGPKLVRYGRASSQRLEYWRPPTRRREGSVMLLHGGFWRTSYDLSLMRPLAHSLADDGWLVANVEYRRVGEPGGGWPGTFVDVLAALAILPRPVLATGHSAGGHLALWLASERQLAGVVGLAAVADIHEAHRLGLSNHAVASLLGASPDHAPERYRRACPVCSCRPACRRLLLHGADDEVVPVDLARRYQAAAGADLVVVPRTDHMVVIDPSSEAWAHVRRPQNPSGRPMLPRQRERSYCLPRGGDHRAPGPLNVIGAVPARVRNQSGRVSAFSRNGCPQWPECTDGDTDGVEHLVQTTRSRSSARPPTRSTRSRGPRSISSQLARSWSP